MAAAYDTYDYPAYWEGREYEHESELAAIKALLSKIEKIGTILEVGAGFGRLYPSYSFRAKKVILTDPSSKLLKIAREDIDDPKVKFIQASVKNINPKVRSGTVDLVILVRVMHHLKDPEIVFKVVNKLLTKRGYFILEFANKRHAKATVKSFAKGDFTFPLDIFPKDLRSKRSKKKKTLPFVNYHPDDIVKKLEDSGFIIEEKRSVSNVRSSFVKKYLPLNVLLAIESVLQKSLSRINIGPSVFVLARKK